MKPFAIVQSALIDGINWQISVLDSCSHMLHDPMAKRALDTALAYANYYEKKYKRECPYMSELKEWEAKAKEALAARNIKKENQK